MLIAIYTRRSLNWGVQQIDGSSFIVFNYWCLFEFESVLVGSGLDVCLSVYPSNQLASACDYQWPHVTQQNRQVEKGTWKLWLLTEHKQWSWSWQLNLKEGICTVESVFLSVRGSIYGQELHAMVHISRLTCKLLNRVSLTHFVMNLINKSFYANRQ